jgi:hypothetical protein
MILVNIFTFISPCIINVFPSITNKMQLYLINLFLQNSLHVSGGSPTHHQELKTVHTPSGFSKLILLFATIVDELELSSSSSTIVAISSMNLKKTRYCTYSFKLPMMAEDPLETFRAFCRNK